ncbi:MAG: quinol:cytochrome C oxidoreductase [Planctomycetota bacterium]
MHSTRPAKITSPVTTLSGGHVRTIPIAIIAGAICIGVALALSLGSEFRLKRFMYTYLSAFCFVLSISVGCLFFVTIMHLTRAGWSVTVRRIAELYAMCLVPLFLLFLPILVSVLMGSDIVYEWNVAGWTHHGEAERAAAASLPYNQLPPLEQLKGKFLNSGFFTIRVIAYFAIWGFMAYFFLSNSLKQDESGDKSLTAKMQAYSAPLMILFAATVVFASFDIEMTLSPLWFSTMFPVYFFAGAILSALCTILLTGMYLQRTGRITDEITVDHYHDLGKLMQGFVIFWGYIAFSQFLLIWYANIPEETFWYDLRFVNNGWRGMSIVLLIGHLFIPFFLLMGRGLRRNRTLLAISAIFILVMHWVDHYWLVMPQMDRAAVELSERATGAHPTFTFSGIGIVIDIACALGVVSLFIAIFCGIVRNRPLVPLQDPRLGEALNHEVH